VLDACGTWFIRASCVADLALTFADIATLDPAGDTLTYPCISWCSAEQKSVQ